MNIKSFIVLYWSCNNKQTFTEQVERCDVIQENDINSNTLKRLSCYKLKTSACRVYKLFLSARTATCTAYMSAVRIHFCLKLTSRIHMCVELYS
jgi:hypothetical protein